MVKWIQWYSNVTFQTPSTFELLQNQYQLKVHISNIGERLNVDLSFGRHSQKLCEECKAILHGTFKDQMSHSYKTTINYYVAQTKKWEEISEQKLWEWKMLFSYNSLLCDKLINQENKVTWKLQLAITWHYQMQLITVLSHCYFKEYQLGWTHLEILVRSAGLEV